MLLCIEYIDIEVNKTEFDVFTHYTGVLTISRRTEKVSDSRAIFFHHRANVRIRQMAFNTIIRTHTL